MSEERFHFLGQVVDGGVLPGTVNVIKHGDWTKFVASSELSEQVQFSVRQVHFLLNAQTLALDERLEFSGFGFFQNVSDKGEAMELGVPDEEFSDSLVGEGADGVDISRAAVVLGEVSSEKVIQMQ